MLSFPDPSGPACTKKDPANGEPFSKFHRRQSMTVTTSRLEGSTK
jgi:hypothetical protein